MGGGTGREEGRNGGGGEGRGTRHGLHTPLEASSGSAPVVSRCFTALPAQIGYIMPYE